MRSEYQIAGISIRVDAPIELIDNDGFSGYRVAPDSQPKADKSFHITLIPQENFAVPAFDGTPVFQDAMHLVLQKGDRCLHLFHIPGTRGVSAWNWILPGGEAELYYHPDCTWYYCSCVGCFNAACIERVLFSAGMYLFHCAYVDDRGGAVLFSAPSGGGKSTQAALWEQYAGAQIMNGDRAALEKNDHGYVSHGLPLAGSSGVFVNRSLPIRAVFVVRKAEQNRAVRLTQQQAFEALFSEITLNTWNHPFVLAAVDFAMEMAAQVPVFRLECRVDSGAVDAARAAIRSLI